MGLFGTDTKKIVKEIRDIGEYYANYFGREIREHYEELQEEFNENENVYADFVAFAQQIKSKLTEKETQKLDNITAHVKKLNRTARNGVEALHDIARDQRRLSSYSLNRIEELQYHL